MYEGAKSFVTALAFYVNGITQYVLLACLSSFTWYMILRFNHVVVLLAVYSFLLLSIVSLNGYSINCLSIHLLMDIWVMSSLGLLQLTL